MSRAYPRAPAIKDRRVAELAALDLLDVPRFAAFDAVVAIACGLFDRPIAAVSTTTAIGGLRGSGWRGRVARASSRRARWRSTSPRSWPSTTSSPIRFAGSPLVAGAPVLRFYAGVPLRPGNASLPGEAARRASWTRARAAAAATLALSHEVRVAADRIHLGDARLAQAERIVGIGSGRFDLRDRSIEWSDHVFAICGLPPGPTPDYGIAMSAHMPAARDELARLIARASVHGAPFDFERHFAAVGGSRRRARSMAEVQHVDGAIVAPAGMFRDVTERQIRGGDRRVIAITIGGAILDDGIGSPGELLRRADVAPHAGKRERRGTGRIHAVGEVVRTHRPRPGSMPVRRARPRR